MKQINPGSLKTKVIFYDNAKGVDSEGFKTTKLSKIYDTKCAVLKDKYVDNKRSTSKNVSSSDTTIKIIVRYNEKINRNMYVEINSYKYRIKEINNIELRNKYVELLLIDG